MKYGLLMVLAILMTGCASIDLPEDRPPFVEIKNINQFAGLYDNIGTYNRGWELSNFVFSSVDSLNFEHHKIQYLQAIPGDKSVTVNAIKNECVIYSKTFKEGEDFNITSGKIELRSDYRATDWVTGVENESRVLGMDINGSIKVRLSDSSLAVFVFIPLAHYRAYDVIFPRVENEHSYDLCLLN